MRKLKLALRAPGLNLTATMKEKLTHTQMSLIERLKRSWSIIHKPIKGELKTVKPVKKKGR